MEESLVSDTTVEFNLNCKRCGKPFGYSGMMYERMKEFGQSRPEYCEDCRKELAAEKMTMGAAYYSLKTLPGVDLSVPIPGELGMVYHPPRPHVKVENPKTFNASDYGATPGKVVEIYEWFKVPGHQVAIVKGGTGSGKSTALPYWLVYPPDGIPEKDFFIRDGQILITQPRILATTGISKYLGKIAGSSVGKGFDIGYRYSKDRNADRFNVAFLATDGILINMIKKGELADLGVVMIDEAHERSLNIDIILHLLKDQLPLYPQLKLLIVSATINAESFLEYFGRETATLVEFEAIRVHSYIVHYAEESEKLDYENPGRLKKQLVPALVKKVVWLLREQVAKRKPFGHVLSFLHGVKPIEEAVALIREEVENDGNLRGKVDVYPLYSDLSEEESDNAIKTSNSSKIKVVVSTNVAEASITVDGVVYVVESGVENQAQWEIESSRQNVVLELISQANAKQRWGLSGRVCNGEVYCLYTEKQFGAMLEFPVPAIQRSSMEQIILGLKQLGIDDYDQDWIDAPIASELERSITSLKNSGAIDEDDMLTEYGVLLGKFNYPASLADLIIMADQFGCAVEVATLLPVIKSGGNRSFLKRETGWDEPTKQKVEKIQQVLWQGCRDDVEFIFRVYSYWKNPPDLSKEKGGKTKNYNDRLREFSETYFLNFDVFEDIENEKAQILGLLSGRRHDRSTRELQFELMDRVRVVLAFFVPFVQVAESEYVFNSRLEIDPSQLASCQLAIANDRVEAIKDAKEKGSSPMSVGLLINSWEKDREAIEVVEKRVLTVPDLPVFDSGQFDVFAGRFKRGDTVEVEVVGYAEHPGDFRVSLIVREPNSSYETWLTPSDTAFTQSSAVIKQIPVGIRLQTVVVSIDLDKKFVQLSRLPFVDDELSKIYKTMKIIDRMILAKATVIDVRTDKRLIFMTEQSRPEEGLILIAHANERALFKEPDKFTVGEECLIYIRVSDPEYEYKANLVSLSEPIKEYTQKSNSRLNWSEGKLLFRGRMRFCDIQELTSLDDDPKFQSALWYLYLSSNMNWVSKTIASDWKDSLKESYPVGQLVDVTVRKVIGTGAILEIGDGQSGFVNSSDIDISRRTSNPRYLVSEGDKYKAKVTGYNEDRQQIVLSLAIKENSPLVRYHKGQQIEGVIGNMVDFGAFVNLGLGYTGLIHVSKMNMTDKKTLVRGVRVLVEILDIKEDRGKLKVSLSLVKILTN